MYGFYTVRAGERVAVWNRDGSLRRVEGPRRLWLWGQSVEALPHYAAGTEEYLVITYRDGRREHQPGPVQAWFDPVEHESLRVERAMAVDGNEALVVYRQEAGGVTRRVVRGPERYVPEANEWLHQFCWHGADPRDHRRKVPGALQFTKLRVIPDQMYFDVPEVRTADDALLVIKLMIFFELVDIDRMLDQTHDPVADFINALSADVIDFAAGHTFEAFKEHTERLNDMATYAQLAQRGERIGYRISKVVYRGYHASETLQAMHDRAIEARTKLRLEAETEEQEVRHSNQMEALSHGELLRRQEAEALQEVENRRRRNTLDMEHQQAMNAERLAFLQGMQGMKVDLTRYLVAQYQHPDRLIRIEEGQKTQVHLHDA